jgi:thiosulfate/3-mercaptopyruvate sulfurtransferase
MRLRFVPAGLLLAMVLWGTYSSGAGPAVPSLVANAQDLPAILAQFNPVVLAVQTKLAARPVGYIRGAVAVDEDQWTTGSISQRHLDDLTMWSRLIGGLGVDAQRMVVVYDDGELKFASRIRYLLAHYGVRRAVLVNGGWQALAPLVQRGPLQGQPAATQPVRRPFMARVIEPPIPIVGRADVAHALGQPTTMIIDVRSPQEYAGTLLLPPVTRGGHVPGAINLPFPNLLVPGRANQLMAPSDLKRVFRSHGIDPAKRIIVYCQDGARSSLVALALVEAQYSSVALYYLSYADWQSDPALPVAK